MPALQPANEPPPYTSHRIYIAKTTIVKVAIIAQPLGHWVHWSGTRTTPCYGEDCPKPMHRRPCRWIAYAPANRLTKLKTDQGKAPFGCLLPVSHADWVEQLAPDLEEFGTPIFYHVYRKTPKTKEVIYELIQPIDSFRPLAVNPELILSKVWGIPPTQKKEENK